jgi:hypothetical protein
MAYAMLYPPGSGQTQAVKRAGEVMAEIEPSKGGRRPETREGDRPSFETRASAARAAGFSDHQRTPPNP